MSDKLCLQWNDFKENVNSAFGKLRDDKEFTDVTLVCEDGQQIEAHKVILASSSPFFEEILQKSKHPHPWIYLRGFQSKDFYSILDFLYFGEANVYQEDFDSFLAIAQCAVCKVYFSAQPNNLKLILNFEKYYPIEHIFVPACSSARKEHFFKF